MNVGILKESVKLNPLGTTIFNKVGNSELRDILHEYYGNNKISYTTDYDNEVWGEVLSYLDKECKLIKEKELSSGRVIIFETDVVNEFLVRYEWDDGSKNFLFWRKEKVNGFAND